MYRRHFHLKDRPFQLVPTPSYLYPSRCHQEALGHLTYALDSGEGFVEVTGEVGTGKTTLLRTFLEGLDGSVSVACIFNPTLNAVELLQSINRDFGISTSSTSRSDLTASIQRFLIENREAGKKALLVIDEAQNLSIEVLEELRLLSNLETTRTKLLQTVLCGQPELGVMLERYELRQLAQRISLSCRLRPLTPDETSRYIVHRLQRAALGDGSELFTPGALKLVYRYAMGLPRVINICCDRALLCAYAAGRDRVDRRSVREAVAELSDRPYILGSPLGHPLLRWGGGALVITMVLLAVVLFFGGFQGTTESPPAPQAEGPPSANAPKTYNLSDLFDGTSIKKSVGWGVERIMGDWGHGVTVSEFPPISDAYLLFSAVAASMGMDVMAVDEDFELILAFGLPALVLFDAGGEMPMALVYGGAEAQGLLRFHSALGDVEMSKADAQRLWAGRALIAFTNPLGFSDTVSEYSTEEEVIALESVLSRSGFGLVSVDGRFDDETRAAVHTLQAAYGIPTDGKVGALTRVALASSLKNWLSREGKRVAVQDQEGGDVP